VIQILVILKSDKEVIIWKGVGSHLKWLPAPFADMGQEQDL
jgi:hypothetical protein